MTDMNEVQQAFLDLKQQKQIIEDAELQRVYENAQVFANKYAETGQAEALKKLIFVLQTVTKERELLKLGFNQFIYKDAIDAYIDQVSVKPIKITELCNYVRDIPQEIVDKVKLTKEIFDEFFVVYTMEQHIHSCKVVGSACKLLTEVLTDFAVFANLQKQTA